MSAPHGAPLPQGNPGSERQNRQKILDQLQEQKKRLQHGHHGSSAGGPSAMSAAPSPAALGTTTASVPGLSAAEYAAINNPQQRAALQHAHVNSVGYFITQDSSFGNLILPVLPRLTDTKADVK